MVEQRIPTPFVAGSTPVWLVYLTEIMFKKIIQFIKETRTELVDKTTWPTRDQVLNTTIVVLISIAIVSVALYGVDMAVSKTVRYAFVDKIDSLRGVVTWYNFLIFIAAVIIIPILINTIRRRIQ